MSKTMSKTTKQSYTVPCPSAFRDAIEALAARRKVNVGDLARSIILAFPRQAIENASDPGDPAPGDRESVVLKSGPSAGRPWRRKPRLQVRMSPGFDVVSIRKALGLALAMEAGDIVVTVQTAEEHAQAQAPQPAPEPEPEPETGTALVDTAIIEEIERLKAMVSALAFEPLPEGVQSRLDALHVLGFHPEAWPDDRTVRARYRMLATIHHPDGHYGDHERMSQLNAAMDMLRRACA